MYARVGVTTLELHEPCSDRSDNEYRSRDHRGSLGPVKHSRKARPPISNRFHIAFFRTGSDRRGAICVKASRKCQIKAEARPGADDSSGRARRQARPNVGIAPDRRGRDAKWSRAALSKNLPFDPLPRFHAHRSFRRPTGVLVIHPSLPVKDLRVSLRTRRRKAASSLTAHPERHAGASDRRAVEAGRGIEMTHVPYKGASLAVLDLIAATYR